MGYGTDGFCALVQRPALARAGDATLTTIMGNVHRYGGRRMPAPGIPGIIMPPPPPHPSLRRWPAILPSP